MFDKRLLSNCASPNFSYQVQTGGAPARVLMVCATVAGRVWTSGRGNAVSEMIWGIISGMSGRSPGYRGSRVLGFRDG